MNLVRRLKSRNQDGKALANLGADKSEIKKALTRILDRQINYEVEGHKETITMRKELQNQIDRDPNFELAKKARSMTKYGYHNELKLNGFFIDIKFGSLVLEVAAETGIDPEKVLPLVWEKLISEIKTDMDEGELVASAFQNEMFQSYDFKDRWERAWDAAAHSGDLNDFAEIMGGSFKKTGFSNATLERFNGTPMLPVNTIQ